MVVVYGNYVTEKEAGFVADFCSVCRDIQTFKLMRIGQASQMFMISLGEGSLAGHLVRCAQCGTARAFEEGRYTWVSQQKCDTQSLVEMTHPNVRTKFAERLALEERVRNNPSSLSASEREELLLEPFEELEPEIQQLDKGTLYQKQAAMWAVLAGGVIMGAGGAMVRFQEGRMGWTIATSIATAIAVWVSILVAAETRGMKRRIMPSLARALKPLQPRKEELQGILKRCREAGLRAGKKVKLNPLWTLLQTQAA